VVSVARHVRQIKKMKKNIFPIFLFLVILAVAVIPIFVFAQTKIPISTNIPGTNSVATEGPGAFVANFYEFALMIGGILAFGVIVYGGVKYMSSAGNPSGQSDAKEWIEAALLGLLLLVGAYFILNIINPQLLNLKLPVLTQLNIQAPVTPPGGVGGGGGNVATGCSGSGCQNLAAAGLVCKDASQQPNKQASCSAAPQMVTTLQCIQSKVGAGNFIVSEAMPPTVAHESRCHQDGCCVDTNLTNFTCAQAQALEKAATDCGGTAVNEYKGCSDTKIYGTTTGGNVHINSSKGNGC
jgi:hypothetical protein